MSEKIKGRSKHIVEGTVSEIERKEKVERIVIEEMQKAIEMKVPLIADCGFGNNWLEAH